MSSKYIWTQELTDPQDHLRLSQHLFTNNWGRFDRAVKSRIILYSEFPVYDILSFYSNSLERNT